MLLYYKCVSGRQDESQLRFEWLVIVVERMNPEGSVVLRCSSFSLSFFLSLSASCHTIGDDSISLQLAGEGDVKTEAG